MAEIDEVREAIYSEDYFDIVVEYDTTIKRIIDEYDEVKFCRPLQDKYAILYVKRSFYNTLISLIGKAGVGLEPFTLGLMSNTALDSAGITRVQNQPFLNLRGNGVIIGIVDTGINYRNKAFIFQDGTSKILNIWDQSIIANAPDGFCYGAEYSNQDINNALKSENPLDIVPSIDENGHGSLLASIVCGREIPEEGFISAAPDSELIVVKLKGAKNNLKESIYIPNSAVAYTSSDIMNGIEYIIKKANEYDMPVSIIIGLGTNQGEHNGFSLFESYITEMARKNKVVISCCVGNEADKQHHTYLSFSETENIKDMEIRVGENENGFPLYIWSYLTDRFSISITSPLGEVIERIYPNADSSLTYRLALENTRITIRFYMPVYQTGDQLIYILFTNPTPGIWRVRLYGDFILLGMVHAWLPISGFIKEDTVFLMPDTFTTITVPSTARIAASVGAYNQITDSEYPPSGRGPTRLESIRPIFVAPGVNVDAYNGNRIVGMTGTGAATAVTGGAAALLLEWGIVKGNLQTMNTTQVINYLIRGAERRGTESYPNNIWGVGKINLYNSFESL